MKPRIAISMGDPGGVGPEVILKALARPEIAGAVDPVIIGDVTVLESHAEHLALSLPEVIQPYSGRSEFTIGAVSAENGLASISYIRDAVQKVLAREADAICTAPISKEALQLAGCNFPGHTEMLAHLSNTDNVRMMLVGGGLQVVLQTIHVALVDVPHLISVAGILESLRIIQQFATDNGMAAPRIAVCGLNPHAGEAGQFGREEIDIITPAIETAAAQGINASGPYPADTIFHRVLQQEFDFVLAMYHDQALIPVKTLDFHGGVNVTLGLPLIRTSPDHGTAFGLAGKNQANESSMVAALLYAADLVKRRKAAQT